MRWRSAQGFTGFAVDHLGFPAGRLNHWRETWQQPLAVFGTIGPFGTSTAYGNWHAKILVAGTGLAAVERATAESDPPSRTSPYAFLSTGDTGGDYAGLVGVPQAAFDPDVNLAMEWDINFNPLLAADREVFVGFDYSALGGIPGAHGAFLRFHYYSLSSHWYCESDNGTVTETTDSGVAAVAARTRFRVEYHGANADDAATERALFFINGVQVAHHTTSLPSAAPHPYAVPAFWQRNASGPSGAFIIMAVGPVNYCNNLYPGDVF
jgi:hypothetical protein